MSNPPTEQSSESPSEDREQRKFQVLSRPDSLRRSFIQMTAGAVLFLIVLSLRLEAGLLESLRAIPSALGVLAAILIVVLPAGVLTLIVIAQLAGTHYGTLQEMTVKLTALNSFLLGLGWLFLLLLEWMLAGHDIEGLFSFGPILSLLAFLLWILVAASLYGNHFGLEFPEALGTFLLVSIVEAGALSALVWFVWDEGWW